MGRAPAGQGCQGPTTTSTYDSIARRGTTLGVHTRGHIGQTKTA